MSLCLDAHGTCPVVHTNLVVSQPDGLMEVRDAKYREAGRCWLLGRGRTSSAEEGEGRCVGEEKRLGGVYEVNWVRAEGGGNRWEEMRVSMDL